MRDLPATAEGRPGGPAPTPDLRTELAVLRRGAAVQLRVLGAIMLRELYTRFGRSNLGYLWLVVEPLILSLGISFTHLVVHVDLPFGFQPASFYASGYIAYITFRNNVNRATSAIESNKALMFHRQVTLADIVIARSLLEFVAVLGAQLLVLSGFGIFGLADWPERPYRMLEGMAFLAWLSTGMAMLIAGASELNPVVERFVHPATYLMIPLSGMFFVLDSLPGQFGALASWFAVPQMTDMVREGLKADFHSTFVNPPYLVLVCALSTLFGLLMLQIARRRMHFD